MFKYIQNNLLHISEILTWKYETTFNNVQRPLKSQRESDIYLSLLPTRQELTQGQ